MHLRVTLTAKLCCLELPGLAILVSKALVLLPRIGYVTAGGYGDLVMLCSTLVLCGWSVINSGVSSGVTCNSTILPQGYRTDPGHYLTGIALDPTSFLCLSRRWGRGEPGELAT